MVDLAVERRQVVSALMTDPVVARLLATHEPFPQLMGRVSRVLMGEAPTAEDRVRAAMTQAGIGGAVSQPIVGGLDDDALRAELLAWPAASSACPDRLRAGRNRGNHGGELVGLASAGPSRRFSPPSRDPLGR